MMCKTLLMAFSFLTEIKNTMILFHQPLDFKKFPRIYCPLTVLFFVCRTKWLSNPWIRGGYSHIASECDHAGYGIRKLGEPVFVDDVPRILLAGEAVHPSHYSTTHGAFESGQQQAAVLHEFISMKR